MTFRASSFKGSHMRTITTNIYLFPELSPEVQAKVISWHRSFMWREDPGRADRTSDEQIATLLTNLGTEYLADGERFFLGRHTQ